MKKMVLFLLAFCLVINLYGENISFLYLGENKSEKFNKSKYLKLSTKKKEIKSISENLLLFSNGGVYSGNDNYEIENKIYSYLKMSAVLPNLEDVVKVLQEDRELEEEMEENKKKEELKEVEYISCNIYKEDGLFPLFKPYKTMQIEELKVALIGVNRVEGEGMSTFSIDNGLKFKEPIKELLRTIRMLEQSYAPDLIVVLSNLGEELEGKKNKSVDDIAKKFSGIVILDSSSIIKKESPRVINDSVIMQVESGGDELARVDLLIEDGKIEKYAGSRETLLSDEIEEDSEMVVSLEMDE